MDEAEHFAQDWQAAQQALQRGAWNLALPRLERCLEQRPDRPLVWLHTAVARFRNGNRAGARTLLDAAMPRFPADAAIAFHAGYLRELDGDDAGAETAYRQALATDARHGDALRNLTGLLRRAGRRDDALASAQTLRAQWPQDESVALLFAACAIDAGRHADAQESLRHLLARQPRHPAALRLLATAARHRHDLDAALPALRTAAQDAPTDALLFADLGQAEIEAGDFAAGAQALARARTLDPAHGAIAWIEALALPVLSDDEASIDAARTRFAAGLGRIEASLRLDSPGAVRDAYGALCRTLPFPLHYQPRDNTALACRFGALAMRVMRAAGGALAEPVDWPEHGGRRRIGFVSAELREHTITRYFGRWLEEFAGDGCELFAWHVGAVADARTARIAARVDHFRQWVAAPLELAAAIRAAKLDALVLLDVGMDPRMLALAALKLARRQYVAYGHPVTTGLTTLDGFLSGAALETPAAQAHYSEPLVRLPGLGAVPDRPAAMRPPSPQQPPRARPRLLCLQSLVKLVPEFDGMLARIAAETGAQIGFFTGGSGIQPLERRLLARLDAAFRRHGMDSARHVELIARTDYPSYLEMIAAADAVLDTPWFSGGATSLDACHAATPVVTLEGSMLRGRQTAAMLRLMGIDRTIAPHADGYVERVVALCENRALREEVRETLRARSSVLFQPQPGLNALRTLLLDGTAPEV